MSDVVKEAVKRLSGRLDGGFDGTAKFVIEGEGAIMVDENGVREGDDDAQVTLTANETTFREITDGSLDPTMAFMTGKLKVDGDMGQAVKLGSALS